MKSWRREYALRAVFIAEGHCIVQIIRASPERVRRKRVKNTIRASVSVASTAANGIHRSR